ncbi:MAG: tetratricopeptide repeat protein [Leptolyngbyaceae cyanobacterium RU_5_1]|nr:tetratricopeptide repeat protein [Leptolyngbyaceae cyanobacterium RU_5_1]
MGLNLLGQRQLDNNSDKPLGGRYKVICQLGVGGFGQTFLVEDLHLPDHPQCVLKQFKPQLQDAEHLQRASRMFDTEARVLYRLGNHDQIPRLLAHFEEEQEFYLAQELIVGEPLDHLLSKYPVWSERLVVALLKDILEALTFVHQQGVIHRDIKPSNLIRRQTDGKIVLIDFGAVKQVSTGTIDLKQGQSNLTIAIGTQGYMPNEQLAGHPRFSSDVYAVGIVAVEALTGVHPKNLKEDPGTSEIAWQHRALSVCPELVDVLSRMIRYDFRDRYSTAAEALEALHTLPIELLESPLNFSAELKQSSISAATLDWLPEPTDVPQGVPGGASTDKVKSDTAVVPVPQPTITAPRHARSQRVALQQSLSSLPTRTVHSLSPTQPSVKRRLPAKHWLFLGGLAAVSLVVLLTKPFQSLQLASRLSTNTPIASPSPAAIASSPSPTLRPISAKVTKTPGTSAATPSPSPNSQGNPANPPTASGTSTTSPSSPAPQIAATSPPQAPSSEKPSNSPPPAPASQAAGVLKQARQLQARGQFQSALALYDQALRLNPSSAEAYWGRCYNLNNLRRLKAAMAACDQALALNPNYPDALWSKGYILDKLQRHSESLELYEQAIALKPNFPEAWSNKGAALLMLRRPAEALSSFDQAIKLKPNFAEAWSNRGAALWSLREFDQAIASIDKAIQLNPNYQDARSLRHQIRQQIGQ